MDKDKQECGAGLQEIGIEFDELVQQGARQIIRQEVEVELAKAGEA